MDALQDLTFLKKLDEENIKTFYTKILVLDMNELPIREIGGRVTGGSISVNGNSSVRRSGSITFIAEEAENDLTNVDNLLALNKKIQILVGLENHIDSRYDDIIWFPQGIFVIVDPTISHSTSGVTINLQFKDKMCLLNGDCGGNLPTSVVFDTYDQIISLSNEIYSNYKEIIDRNLVNDYTVYRIQANGQIKTCMWDEDKGFYDAEYDEKNNVKSVKQRMYDIIQTIVANYGREDLAKIIIEDVPRDLKASFRYVGGGNGESSGLLYYPDKKDSVYGLSIEEIKEYKPNATINDCVIFGYNEECGYTYTPFTYPGKELTSSIGDNVCTILDKIKNALGNYEYFYDIDGRFIFREKKNYLNTQYNPIKDITNQTDKNNLMLSTNGSLLNGENYMVDFSNNSASMYTFDETSNLISSYSNAPKYTNIKNDFHIWGKNNDGHVIHYHLAIKEKPSEEVIKKQSFPVIYIKDGEDYTGKIRLAKHDETPDDNYIAEDWRAYLYLVGLTKLSQNEQRRPDIYEQELIDLFDDIYDMKEKKFKGNIVNRPNELTYWFDYIDPLFELKNISVDAIGPRIHSYQQDNIIQLYSTTIPNVVLMNRDTTDSKKDWIQKQCKENNDIQVTIPSNVFNTLAIGAAGYSAQEVARSLIYQYIDFNAGISLNCIPIYYLDVNGRITVQDKKSGISGDYIVNSINVPLDARNSMSISASRALERI